MRKIAIQAVKTAGEILINYLEGEIPNEVKEKGYKDIVTAADLASGQKIKEIILQNFPDHQVICEEKELDQNTKSEYTWFVDPLDGTVYMRRRFPKFGIYLGLNKNNETILAVGYHPYNDDLFVAEKDRGTFFINETRKIHKKVRVSNIPSLEESYIGYAHGKSKQDITWTANFIKTTMPSCFRMSKLSGAEVCYVANGSFEAWVCNATDPWETFMLMLLVEEAGGKVTDFAGNQCDQFSKNIVLSNGLIHSQLLEFINSVNSKTT